MMQSHRRNNGTPPARGIKRHPISAPASQVKSLTSPAVKICGITRPQDAETALQVGAAFLGLVFAPSARRVNGLRAREIMGAVPKFHRWVAVFVNATMDSVARLASTLGITYLQLHGRETPSQCQYLLRRGFQVIKAISIKEGDSLNNVNDYSVPYLLFDTYHPKHAGGTGRPFHWQLLAARKFKARIFLSGGLTAALVKTALSYLSPYAVDVSSGVESSPGIKDGAKVAEFIRAANDAYHAES